MDNRHWQYYNPNPYYHPHHHPHHHPHMNPHHRPVCCQPRAEYQEHVLLIYLFFLFWFCVLLGYFYKCSEDLYQLPLKSAGFLLVFFFLSKTMGVNYFWSNLVFVFYQVAYLWTKHATVIWIWKKVYEFYILFIPVLDPGVLCQRHYLPV